MDTFTLRSSNPPQEVGVVGTVQDPRAGVIEGQRGGGSRDVGRVSGDEEKTKTW